MVQLGDRAFGKVEAEYMILGSEHHHDGQGRSRGGLLRARLLTGVMLAALVAGGAGSASSSSLQAAARSSLQTNPDVGIVADNKRAVEYELDQGLG